MKIRRGNHVFLAWAGDHGPRQEHVYKDGKFIVKWDLENREVMRGAISARILRLIDTLEAEGQL